MKLYFRIIIFLTACFALISGMFLFVSITSLSNSQKNNLASFRNEFVELSRELFQNSSDVFFDYFEHGSAGSEFKSKDEAIEFFRKVDPHGEKVSLIDMQSKAFVDGFENSNLNSILNEKAISSLTEQWVLNGKSDFEISNYQEFIDGKTSLAPYQVNVKLYEPIGLIVSYGKVFETGKIRIDFIKKKNEEYSRQAYYFSIAVFFSTAILISLLAIWFMKRTIVNPLLKLKNITTEVGKGNLNTKIEVMTKDEIGDLASSFNKMSKKLLESRRKTEEKVKELSVEHDKLSSLVESVKLGVIMVDLSLNVILSNFAAKKVLGRAEAEKLTFKDLSEKIKDSIDVSQALSYYVHTGTPLNIQEVMIDDRYFRLFMSPVRDIIEKVFIGAVIVMEDITEQKKLDKMRTEIVSITSHQLRTPSTIIKGNLEMVLGGDVGAISDQQKELLQDTYLGNQRMIRLINDLMDVAKIDEGKFKLSLEPAQLEDVVKEVITNLGPLIKEKHINLVYEYPSSPFPPVKINRQRVTQVIQNIIDNAVKYSSNGDNGKVVVEIQEVSKFLELIVKDDGIGIPEGEQDRMFERFSRGSNTTKLDPGGGSGLGLYIAKAVIEQGGGGIWFKSKEGEGTDFHITFPYNG